MNKVNECIDNLEQQIRWIEEIDAHKFSGWGHTVDAMKQAVVLLKAQEPRAMTLEEIRTTKPAMYIMYKSEDGEGYLHEYALFSHAHDGVTEMIVADSYRPLVALIDSDYGKVWICWTSRPDAKRKEVTLWAQTNG